MAMENTSLMGRDWQGLLYSGGWRPGAGPLAVMEPATGQVLVSVGLAGAAQVAAAAERAVQAQPAWAALHPAARAAILRRAADLLRQHREEAAGWLVREGGSIQAKARLEPDHAVGFIEHAAAQAVEPRGHVLPADPGTESLAERVALGVVGVISPFNFPLVLSLRAVAPALAAGNAVLLKPDPRTPVSGGLLIARLFEAAGLPPNLLHVLPGHAEAGEEFCTNPAIAMVSFTGSTRAGRRVGALCGENLKKVQLELGGKNPLIVLDDADPDLAAANAAWGAWLHQGQICMATGRILLQQRIAETVTRRLVEKARHLRVGDPHTDPDVALGPLITPQQVQRVDTIVQDSVKAGAKLLAGGRIDDRFYAPTVLADVRPGMPAFSEELFGPVAVITTFTDDAEAVRLANATSYGLAGAVIGADLTRARSVAAKLRVGHLHVNDQTVLADPSAPFGGFGLSGNGGRISGPANWDEFSTWRWSTVKASPPAYPF